MEKHISWVKFDHLGDDTNFPRHHFLFQKLCCPGAFHLKRRTRFLQLGLKLLVKIIAENKELELPQIYSHAAVIQLITILIFISTSARTCPPGEGVPLASAFHWSSHESSLHPDPLHSLLPALIPLFAANLQNDTTAEQEPRIDTRN